MVFSRVPYRIFTRTAKILHVGNHLHLYAFEGKFFVLTSITAKKPGHGTGGQGRRMMC